AGTRSRAREETRGRPAAAGGADSHGQHESVHAMTMNDWSRRVGETHGRRARATSLAEQKAVDREHQRDAECLQRWPAIVAAMRTVVAGYNHGVGLEAV